jgi:exosortase/archaeosortase family protein
MNLATVLILEAVAFWPVWIWWANRMAGEAEAAWGLAALITAAWFAWRKTLAARPPQNWLPCVAAAMVSAYGISFWVATPIFRAAIATATIGTTLVCWRRVRCAAGVIGLCVIALPVSASLQFVAGFPMRLAASAIGSGVLAASGAVVAAEGTGLRWNGGLAEVDAACSGIRMLWAGLYLGLTAACVYDVSTRRTFGIMCAAVAAVVLGNALRTAGLFYLEGGLLPVPDAVRPLMHAGAGLAVFSVIGTATVSCARW